MNNTLKTLTEKGKAMRQAQRAYFASAGKMSLDRQKLLQISKDAEREFDAAIKAAEKAMIPQVDMFKPKDLEAEYINGETPKDGSK